MTCVGGRGDRKSTRLNSSHTVIYTLSLHDALPILMRILEGQNLSPLWGCACVESGDSEIDPDDMRWWSWRSEEHTSELQSHRDLHSFPTRRSSDLDADSRGPESESPLGLRLCREW